MVDKLRPKSVRAPGQPCAWAESDGILSELIEYSDVIGGTGTVAIGTLPAGAVFTRCRVWVLTAFDAGANNALIVGIPTDTDYFVESFAPIVANAQIDETNVLDYTTTAEVVVSAIFTHTGSVPTAGKARVVIEFERPL